MHGVRSGSRITSHEDVIYPSRPSAQGLAAHSDLSVRSSLLIWSNLVVSSTSRATTSRGLSHCECVCVCVCVCDRLLETSEGKDTTNEWLH